MSTGPSISHDARAVVRTEPAPTGPPMRSEVNGEIWYPAPAPAELPAVGVDPDRRSRTRPWWGLGDVLAAVPFIVVVSTLALVGAIAVSVATGVLDLEAILDDPGVEVPAAAVAAGLVGQQLAQGVWPWIVSRRKGRGMATDWGWSMKPIDLAIGPAAAFASLVLAGVVGAIVAQLVGVEQAVDNAEFVSAAEGTTAFWVLIAAVVIGAPLSEELFFRGLVLRAFEKRGGPVLGVVGSTLLFTLPHYVSASAAEIVVLLGSIGSVGLVLGIVAVRTRRLAPVIIAHVLFNGVAALQLVFG